MNIGKDKRNPRYICNKCGDEIPFIHQKGFVGITRYCKNTYRDINYKKDFDDNFDNTYTYIQFSVPEEYIKTCKMIAPKEERLSVGELFKKEVEESAIPGTEAYKRMEKIADEIMKNIEEGNPFIGL